MSFRSSIITLSSRSSMFTIDVWLCRVHIRSSANTARAALTELHLTYESHNRRRKPRGRSISPWWWNQLVSDWWHPWLAWLHIHPHQERTRINLLIYLSDKDWQEDWGGATELWDSTFGKQDPQPEPMRYPPVGDAPISSAAPIFNRALVSMQRLFLACSATNNLSDEENSTNFQRLLHLRTGTGCNSGSKLCAVAASAETDSLKDRLRWFQLVRRLNRMIVASTLNLWKDLPVMTISKRAKWMLWFLILKGVLVFCASMWVRWARHQRRADLYRNRYCSSMSKLNSIATGVHVLFRRRNGRNDKTYKLIARGLLFFTVAFTLCAQWVNLPIVRTRTTLSWFYSSLKV